MKDPAFVAINLVLSLLLALGLIALVTAFWLPPWEALPFVLLSSIVLADAITYLTRNDAKRWSRFLLVTAMGALSGGAVFLLLLLCGAIERSGPRWFGTLIAVGCCVLVLVFVFTHRRPRIAVLVAAVMILALLVSLQLCADRQLRETRQYSKLWSAKGWPVDAGSVFPKPSTRVQCQAWIDVCNEVTEGELKQYYDEVGFFTNDVAAVLASGGDVRDLVTTSELIADPRWGVLENLDIRALAAAKQCPYLQWFDAKDFADSPWDIPLPNLRAMILWARGMSVHALHLAAKGETEQAQALALDLVDASRRMQVRGQVLITTLVSVAMERWAVVTLVGIQGISEEPLPDEVLSRVQEFASPDIEIALSSLVDVERYIALKDCQHLPPRFVADREGIFEYFDAEVMLRAAMSPVCREGLEDYTSLRGWFDTAPNLKEVDSAWHRARVELPAFSDSAMVPGAREIYARMLNLVGQWRQVLAVDAVLRHRANAMVLPDSAGELGSTWPEDPYDRQPMRYRQLDPSSFVVYSVGPDEVDQQGEKLFVSGILPKLDNPLDVGVRLTLR